MKKILIILLFIDLISITAQVKSNKNLKEKVLRVPVAFHIISSSNPEYEPNRKITHEDLRRLIKQININFNNVEKSKIDPLYANIAVGCNIEFYIPNNCENGEKYITYHKSNIKEFESFSTEPFRIVGNELLDSSKYLNICIANIRISKKKWYQFKGFFAKWSPFYKGIIINPLMFYWDYENPWEFKENDIANLVVPKVSMAKYILTHEFGHALGLKHIWGYSSFLNIVNGCDFTITDNIKDTPPQKSKNNVFNSNVYDKVNNKWIFIQKVCNEPNKLSNYQNYMDYSMGLPNGVGMFTEEQKAKMRTVIKDRGYIPFHDCNSYTSVLNKTELRHSVGYEFRPNYPLGSSPPFEVKGFFIKNFNVSYNKENLKILGFIFLGKGLFKDKWTGEQVSQKDIYQRIIIEKAKKILNSYIPTATSLKNAIVNYEVPSYYVFMKFTNIDTQKVIEKRLGDLRQGSFKLPTGNYSLEIYHYKYDKMKYGRMGNKTKIINARTVSTIYLNSNTMLSFKMSDDINIVITNSGKFVPIHIYNNSSNSPSKTKKGNTLKRLMNKRNGMDEYNRKNREIRKKLKKKYGF